MINFRKFHKSSPIKSPKSGRPAWLKFKHHPIVLPAATFTFLCLLAGSTYLIINRSPPKFKPLGSYVVIISHDHEKQTIPSQIQAVGSLLNKLHIAVNKGDVVEPSRTTLITEDNFHINVYRAQPIEIIDGQQKTYTLSAASTPRSIAVQAGVKVYPADEITDRPVANFVSAGSISRQLIISPATPVNFNLYGTATIIRTQAKTIGQLLKEKTIKLSLGDNIEPGLDAPITANMQVFLSHQGVKIESVSQAIAMPTQTIRDDSLTFGTSAVRQQGSPGSEVLTYQDNLINGQIVGRSLIQTVITQQPVVEIIARGSDVLIPSAYNTVMAEAGIPASDYAYVNYIMSHESGWCPTKVQGQVGYCPSAPPSSIPYGRGYGLGQATPGNKMAGFGSDWQSNPVTQLRWANSYANSAHGGWAGAYNYWVNNHNW
ncbi:MAG: G5 domain-containing protein [Candidatus Saccharimonadales bacterium]